MEKLNKLLADVTVLNNKVRGIHYNVCGIHFMDAHEFMEKEYDQLTEWIDEIAEGIKMKHVDPILSLKEMLEITTIQELDLKEIKSCQSYKILEEDYKKLLEEIKSIDKEQENAFIDDLLTEMEIYLNKKIWILESINKRIQ